MRALLVDPNASAAHAIMRMLEADGFVTDHTNSGRAALELTRRHEYDVILLDLGLEGGQGGRILRLLRNSCATPVLALSCSARTETRAEALASGAADHMAKPFQRQELMAHLNAVLGQGVLRQNVA